MYIYIYIYANAYICLRSKKISVHVHTVCPLGAVLVRPKHQSARIWERVQPRHLRLPAREDGLYALPREHGPYGLRSDGDEIDSEPKNAQRWCVTKYIHELYIYIYIYIYVRNYVIYIIYSAHACRCSRILC